MRTRLSAPWRRWSLAAVPSLILSLGLLSGATRAGECTESERDYLAHLERFVQGSERYPGTACLRNERFSYTGRWAGPNAAGPDKPESQWERVQILNCLYHIPREEAVRAARELNLTEDDPALSERIQRVLGR